MKLGLIGTIDSDYRGEICAVVFNPSATDQIVVETGDKVGQLVFLPVPEVEWWAVDELPGTKRGTQGFGSSGR